MNFWLYQMNATKWPIERYRAEVWEGSDVQNWGVGKIRSSVGLPQPGDMVMLFCVKASQIDPGIYGWGIVLRCDESEMNFRLATPSDYLKMSPLWDEDIDETVANIRGTMPRYTLFEDRSRSLQHLRRRIAQHLYGNARCE